MEKSEIINIPFDSTREIVAERYSHNNLDIEMPIYLRDIKTKRNLQDIALVRKNGDKIECDIYGDAETEDRIDCFLISPYIS